MAAITNFLSKPTTSIAIINKIELLPSHLNPQFLSIPSVHRPPQSRPRTSFIPRATAASKPPQTAAVQTDEKVLQIHSAKELDEALVAAKSKLVVVEFAAFHSTQSSKIYPFMVDLSRTCSDVVFLLVLGDESDETRELFRREKIEKVPHFSFYKNSVKIHEEEGIGPDVLMGDVLYYGDSHSSVAQLHSREDVERLIDSHREDHKLIVLDVGLKHCGPCVKIYPTVLKLSRQMEDTVLFARMNGDENDSCMQFLKDMNVVQVPTFLFIKDGKICGRYVGSGRGELIGELLRYQGVRVTY